MSCAGSNPSPIAPTRRSISACFAVRADSQGCGYGRCKAVPGVVPPYVPATALRAAGGVKLDQSYRKQCRNLTGPHQIFHSTARRGCADSALDAAHYAFCSSTAQGDVLFLCFSLALFSSARSKKCSLFDGASGCFLPCCQDEAAKRSNQNLDWLPVENVLSSWALICHVTSALQC